MLQEAFFARDARTVARALIGSYLVHETPQQVHIARIAETEAYRGPEDRACHARFGETPRTKAIFGRPATAYCFLVYGMHDCFNVVTRREGSGHAVLLRGATVLSGEGRADGPGRLARVLGFSRKDNGRSCTTPSLFFAAGPRVRVVVTPRVGVAYAEAHADLPLRFCDARGDGVSRPPASQVGRGKR
jgi:DNA-3-methyladenine glycosylase